jgi:hypothetical protein
LSEEAEMPAMTRIAAYATAINACNGCHAGMGYGFINVVKLGAPANNGVDYKIKSNPGDVPP